MQGRWLGAASISQLRGFLKDGETAALAALSGQGLDPLLLTVRTADQAFMAKDFAGADETMDYDEDYCRALEVGMPPTAGEGSGPTGFSSNGTLRLTSSDPDQPGYTYSTRTW